MLVARQKGYVIVVIQTETTPHKRILRWLAFKLMDRGQELPASDEHG